MAIRVLEFGCHLKMLQYAPSNLMKEYYEGLSRLDAPCP